MHQCQISMIVYNKTIKPAVSKNTSNLHLHACMVASFTTQACRFELHAYLMSDKINRENHIILVLQSKPLLYSIE